MEPGTTFAALLGRLREAYEDSPGTKVAGVPGQVTTADWCQAQCSQVYLRLDNMFRSQVSFPNPDNTPDTCGSVMAAVWHLGVWRCVHGLDGQGYPPPVEAQTEDAVQLLDDTCRLRSAAAAFIANDLVSGKGATLLGRWTPMGPMGNCAGGYWSFTTKLGRVRPS